MKNNFSYYNIFFKIKKLSRISYFMAWDQTTIHRLILVFYSKFLPQKNNLISSIAYTCYIALIFFSSKPLFFLTFWRALADFFTECFSILSVLSPMMASISSRNMTGPCASQLVISYKCCRMFQLWFLRMSSICPSNNKWITFMIVHHDYLKSLQLILNLILISSLCEHIYTLILLSTMQHFIQFTVFVPEPPYVSYILRLCPFLPDLHSSCVLTLTSYCLILSHMLSVDDPL